MSAYQTESEKACMPWPNCKMAKIKNGFKAVGPGTKETKPRSIDNKYPVASEETIL